MDFRFKLVPTVLGAVVLFLGFQEWRLAIKAKANAQTLTAADLVARGPADNAHIVLTDFQMCTSYLITTKKERFGNKEKWQSVFIPAVPADSDYARQLRAAGPGMEPPPPNDIRILIKSNNARDEAAVDRLFDMPLLQGMVVNEIESLGGEDKKKLAERYPGIDFARCWIFQIERKPAGAMQVMGMMGGGGMLALAGAAWMVAGRSKR